MKKSTKLKRKILLVGAGVSSLIYIGWRMFFTIPVDYGLISFIAGLLLVTSEAVGIIEAFSHYRNLSSDKCPEKPDIPNYWYPHVDVFIATHSESTELLYKTINGCIHMDYPDKSKVHVYICDDSDRLEMKLLAKKMGIGYIGINPEDNKHAKAGNINNALAKTDSPLIVTFDADMIPRSDFLMETIPYFYLPLMKKDENKNWVKREKDEIDEDYKIGFIQTPQSFYNPDLFQYNLFAEQNIPNEQDYFFKEVNVGRNRTNSPIYAGSNTVISRQALEEAGGITVGTITEDFATGMKIQANGYRCYAIPKVLANGLAPTDFKSLLKQRQRWGRGCVQTLRSFKFLFSNLPIRSKLSYITCLLYWGTFFRRFVYIMSPILYTVFGLVVVECSFKELLFIWMPSYILYNYALRVLSGKIRNQKWSNIVDTIIFPYMIIPIFLETIGIKLKKFAVTPKNRVSSKNTEIHYAIPHIILIIATLIGLIFSIEDIIKYKAIGGLVLVYWSIMNLYFLIMAVFFMCSRVNYRNEERYYTKLNVEIHTKNDILKGVTSDISEGGMAIILDTPEYIPYDEDIDIRIYYLGYKASVKGSIAHVANVKDKWKYSVKINHTDEKNKREYYQIVYDRDHTLPTKMKSNTIKELFNNTVKRVKSTTFSNRKLPRIPLGVLVRTSEGQSVEIINFNYEYILIRNNNYNQDIMDINLSEDLTLKCKIKSINEENGNRLYHIENWKDISNNIELKAILLGWINKTEKTTTYKEEAANV